MRHCHYLIFALAALLAFSRSAAAAPTTRPYILHLPGVGGFLAVDRSLLSGLMRGGVNADIVAYDWTEHDPGLNALHAYDRNQKEAQHVADLITARARAYPGGRIIITSHSGGGAIAAWALEHLPGDVKVDTVLLLAPALSPGYDLTPALKHITGQMHVYSSMEDELVLGYGCRFCGTMDGEKTDAAGRVGFNRPKAGDAEQYKKLISHPYDSDWAVFGNLGDHIGPMMCPFVTKILVPLIVDAPTAAVRLANITPTTEPAVAP